MRTDLERRRNGLRAAVHEKVKFVENRLAELYGKKKITMAEAARSVEDGERVFVGFSSSVANAFMEALWARRAQLKDVEIQLSNGIMDNALYCGGEEQPFHLKSPFMGPGERRMRSNGGEVAYTSIHLSQIRQWFSETARPTLCFFSVSPPDENGYMSFGPTGVSCNVFAQKAARRIVVQVNENVPYICGEATMIHLSEVDAIVEYTEPLPCVGGAAGDEITETISDYIVEQIPDGATIQIGIGNIAAAVGQGLRTKNDLGIHTELFSPLMMELIRAGNVTNTRKGYMDGRSVFAFAVGDQEMYDFMDHNQSLYGGTFQTVNDPRTIARNNQMMSINGAMAVNLYGEAASEGLGWKQYSGVGGQLDFVRGAQWSPGGKSFLALKSSYLKNGVRHSKIVLNFPQGTPVTTPRSDIQYVVTEYGCVNLKHLTMRQRVMAMISLAHPDFREELRSQAHAYQLI